MTQAGIHEESRDRLMRGATQASLSVAITLIVIKLVAFFVTGSVALLSSLIDSILDSFASGINYLAVRASLEPADNEHRFGHGKVEPLAGLAQAAFIIGSSLFIAFEAVERLFNPVRLEHGSIGIAVMLVSLLLTIALVIYQRYVIRQTGSIAIAADAFHYVSDIAMNLGVIIALALTWYTGWVWVDPAVALAIAVYIVYTAWSIIAGSLAQLIDRELPDPDRRRIEELALSHEQVLAIHDLRTRASGKHIFIQLHLELDGGMNLYQAHRIADEVEHDLRSAYPEADIIIHQDPVEI